MWGLHNNCAAETHTVMRSSIISVHIVQPFREEFNINTGNLISLKQQKSEVQFRTVGPLLNSRKNKNSPAYSCLRQNINKSLLMDL